MFSIRERSISESKKVTFVNLSSLFEVGGIQTFSQYFLKALDENNFEVELLTLHGKSKVDLPNYMFCRSNYAKFLYYYIRCLTQSEVIIYNHVSVAFFGKIAKYFIPYPRHVVIAHGTEVWGIARLPWFKRLGISAADEIWAVSRFTRDRIFEKGYARIDQIQIYPNCIDVYSPKYLCSEAAKKPLKDNKTLKLVTMMRLDPSPKIKSVILTLKAVKLLRDREINVKFDVIGGGMSLSKLVTLTENEGLSEIVSFKGYLENPSNELAEADVFVLVSSGEGFGIVYLEAILFDLVCIGAKGCGAESVIEDDVTGLLVSPEDVEGLAYALERLNSNSSLKTKLIKNASRKLQSEFTYEQFRARQLNYLQSLLGAS